MEKTYKKFKQTLDVKAAYRQRKTIDDEDDMENLPFTNEDAKNKDLVMALLKKKGRKPRGFYKIIMKEF